MTPCILVTEDGRIFKDQRELTGTRTLNGYCSVGICGKRFYVHRLVAQTYLGPAPFEGATVNHKNGNKLDNHVDNLEWLSRADNARHQWANGLANVARGEQAGNAKLTEDDVREIRLLLASGDSHRTIARKYGISRGPIGRIARGQLWRHVA